MKKILLTCAALGLTVGAYAQGTLAFSTATLTGPVASQSGTNAPVTLGGVGHNGAFTVDIYSVATTAIGAGIDPDGAEANLLTLTKTYVYSSTDFPIAGKFNGGVATFANVAPGAVGFFEVSGWTGSFANYAAAVAGGAAFGFTTVWENVTGGVGTPPSTPVSISSANWNGALLLTSATAPMPEPTTIALGGLGAAALLMLRRRK